MTKPPDQPVYSVSQLTRELKSCLQTHFSSVWIAGEISDVAIPQSGHLYMTLKDDQAQIKVVMWRSSVERLRFPVEDGMEVLCQGTLDIYPPRGNYQLIVRKMELRGEGAAQRALRQLHAKLEQEGLFLAERKRRLPLLPQRIAVVTSPTGAAIRDFLEVTGRRWRGTDVVIVPTRVQGAGSVEEVVRGIELANHRSLRSDVIVLTRGGGSMEDLLGFNDERVVRAIHASRLPVVSAIGHEIDVTLSDLVADVRALTPSEAAELVVPSELQMIETLRHWGDRMQNQMRSRCEHVRSRIDAIANSRVLRHPDESLRSLSQRVDELNMRLERGVRLRMERAESQMTQVSRQLNSLSPLAVLSRGYSVTQRPDGGGVVSAAEEVAVGDLLDTRLGCGSVTSRVEGVFSGRDASDTNPTS